MSPAEERAFRAAARAQRATGATITTHTEAGRIGLRQLSILLDEGADPSRIVIGHLDMVADTSYHAEIARAARSSSSIGSAPRTTSVTTSGSGSCSARSRRVFAGQVLLSHDTHALHRPESGVEAPRPFTSLFGEFLPRLAAAGVDAATLERIVAVNPLLAFGRRVGEPIGSGPASGGPARIP